MFDLMDSTKVSMSKKSNETFKSDLTKADLDYLREIGKATKEQYFDALKALESFKKSN